MRLEIRQLIFNIVEHFFISDFSITRPFDLNTGVAKLSDLTF